MDRAAWEIAPGYEGVAGAFVELAPLLGAGGASFAVLLDGRPVVDLWGGDARPGEQGDTGHGRRRYICRGRGRE